MLQGGEGLAVPLADLAKEKERPRSPKWRCCACRGDLPVACDTVKRWNSSQRGGNIAAGEAGKGGDGPRAHGLGGIVFFPGGRRFGGASGRVCHGGLEGPELTMRSPKCPRECPSQIFVPLSIGCGSGVAISVAVRVQFAAVSIVKAAPRPAASASKESTGWLPDLRNSDTSLGKSAHGGLDGARGQLAFSAEHSALALASSSSVLQQVGSGPPGAWAAERPAERKRCSGRGSDLRGSFCSDPRV